MFDSTLELITQAVSNSIFVFCFCNLIIVMILIGSNSKPRPNCNQASQEVPTSAVANTCIHAKQAVTVNHYSIDGKMLIDVRKASNTQEMTIDSDKERDISEDYNKDSENDEFRRRVEEFIDKVNRGWKAESLRPSHLV